MAARGSDRGGVLTVTLTANSTFAELIVKVDEMFDLCVEAIELASQLSIAELQPIRDAKPLLALIKDAAHEVEKLDIKHLPIPGIGGYVHDIQQGEDCLRLFIKQCKSLPCPLSCIGSFPPLRNYVLKQLPDLTPIAKANAAYKELDAAVKQLKMLAGSGSAGKMVSNIMGAMGGLFRQTSRPGSP